MSEYNLQPSYPDVSALTTNDKAISVMYGRVPITGEIVPILVDASGAVTTSGGSGGITSLTGDVTASGSGAVAATVVTNANLTGDVTSVGNATTLTKAAVANHIVAILSTGNTPATGINETATVPGLLTTDTVLAVTQITTGASMTQPLMYITGLTGLHPTVAGQIGINFVADPGAGTVVLVTVLR